MAGGRSGILQVANVGGWVQNVSTQSWKEFMNVTLLAVAFLLSVVLNNAALRHIEISFLEVQIQSASAARFIVRAAEMAWVYVCSPVCSSSCSSDVNSMP